MGKGTPAAEPPARQFEVIVPAGVTVRVEANEVTLVHPTGELELGGAVAIRISNGVEVRGERIRMRPPEKDDPAVRRSFFLTIEAPAAAPPAAAQNPGQFTGLGLLLDQNKADDGSVVVTRAIEGAGEDVRAAVRPKDRITHVDGKPVKELTVAEVVKLIRGPAGSPVRLTLLHEGETTPVEVTLKRQVFNAEARQ